MSRELFDRQAFLREFEPFEVSSSERVGWRLGAVVGIENGGRGVDVGDFRHFLKRAQFDGEFAGFSRALQEVVKLFAAFPEFETQIDVGGEGEMFFCEFNDLCGVYF